MTYRSSEVMSLAQSHIRRGLVDRKDAKILPGVIKKLEQRQGDATFADWQSFSIFFTNEYMEDQIERDEFAALVRLEAVIRTQQLLTSKITWPQSH